MTPPGTPCSLTVDLEGSVEPGVGDLMVSNGGSEYLVVNARRVVSTTYPNRWKLGTVKVDPEDRHVHAVRVIRFVWHERERRS